MKVNSQLKSGYSVLTLLGTAGTAVFCAWLLTEPERMRMDFIARLSSKPPAKVRHASEVDWHDVSEGKLYDGSFVDIPLNADAVLKWNATHTEKLVPGSIVRVSQSGGHARMEVILRKDPHTGKLEYRKLSELGGSLDASLTEVRLLSPLEDTGHDTHRLVEMGARIEKAYQRVLTFDYVIAYTKFPELHEFGAFDDYGIKPVYPPVGVIYKPAQEERPCLSFVWSPVPMDNVDYVLEISKTAEFGFFRSFGATKNFLKVRVNHPSDYFWRVSAVRGTQKIVGDISRFTVYKAPLPEEEARRLAVARRIREENAWIMDLELCN